MATINGISLKSIKAFRDHEGATIYQGNIYIDGKKKGFWSQDSMGGCDEYIADSADRKANKDFIEILNNRAVKFKESHPKTYKYYDIIDIDILMYTLMRLTDLEKTYKKFAKSGYPYMLTVSNFSQCKAVGVKKPFNLSDKPIMNRIEKIKNEMGKGKFVVNKFASEDFNITCDSKHPVPEFVMNDPMFN